METPEGAQFGQGQGQVIIIRGGAPMLLTATGTEKRRGLALILHDSSPPARPWTTTGSLKGYVR